MLHIKNGSKSNTNSQLQSQFSPRISTLPKKNYANNYNDKVEYDKHLKS